MSTKLFYETSAVVLTYSFDQEKTRENRGIETLKKSEGSKSASNDSVSSEDFLYLRMNTYNNSTILMILYSY